MYCSSCGSQLPPGARVCPTCGIPIPSNVEATSYDYTVPASPAYNSASDVPYPTQPVSQAPYSIPPPPYSMPPPPPSAYSSPQGGSPPSYAPPTLAPPRPPEPKRPRRFSGGRAALLLALIVLLLGGSGLIYNATVYQPRLMHDQATATAATSTALARATNQAQIKATSTIAAENLYTHSGTLALADPLNKNDKKYNWDENTNCAFTGGTYHAIAPDPRYSDYCIASSSDFNDFAFEAQMTILKGDAGGVIFRVENTNPNQYYNFSIRQDGAYYLEAVNGSGGPTLTQGSSPAIKQGLNQTNLIAVVAQGTNIALYVNHQLLGNVTDSTYSRGPVGLFAVVYTQPTEVAFSNAKVWTYQAQRRKRSVSIY